MNYCTGYLFYDIDYILEKIVCNLIASVSPLLLNVNGQMLNCHINIKL